MLFTFTLEYLVSDNWNPMSSRNKVVSRSKDERNEDSFCILIPKQRQQQKTHAPEFKNTCIVKCHSYILLHRNWQDVFEYLEFRLSSVKLPTLAEAAYQHFVAESPAPDFVRTISRFFITVAACCARLVLFVARSETLFSSRAAL